jgi:hypothetical protein
VSIRDVLGLLVVAATAFGCGAGTPDSSAITTPAASSPTLPSTPASPSATPVGTPNEPDPLPPSPSESPFPSPETPVPSAEGTPAAAPQVPGAPFDLSVLQWATVTEPFSGDLAQEVEGLYSNAAGEIVAWGRDQEWINSDVGEATTSLWTSADGVDWRDQRIGPLGSNQFITDVAHGPSGLVAVGYEDPVAAAWWSTDGDAWTRASRGPDDRARGVYARTVAAGPDGFLAVGSDHQRAAAWFSSNGDSWESVGGSFPKGSFEDVAASPDGGFVVVGTDTSRRGWDAVAWRVSSDGSDWSPANPSDALAGPEDEQMYRLWGYNGGYLGFGQQVDTQERIDCYQGAGAQVGSTVPIELARVCYWGYSSWRLFKSENGDAWERIDPEVETYVFGDPYFWEFQAIAPWGEGLIAVGAGTDWQIRVWTSLDGVEWEAVGDPVLVNGQPAPAEYQSNAVDAVLVDDGRLVIGGELETSDGYVMIATPAS